MADIELTILSAASTSEVTAYHIGVHLLSTGLVGQLYEL